MQQTKWIQIRIYLVSGVLLSLLLAVVLSAYRLQITDGQKFKEMAEGQYLRDIELPSRRGSILDRRGTPLAISVEVDSVFANPRVVGKDADRVAKKLAAILGIPKRRISKTLRSKRYFRWIKRRITPRLAAEVRAAKLPGIQLTRESRRFYPNRKLGGLVLGFSNLDGRGLAGVERAYDGWLRGSRVRLPGLRDARGRRLLADGFHGEVTAGHDAVLTLDKTIQYDVERALAKAKLMPKTGWAAAVVMDVQNGDILAMSSAPNFDPNLYAKAKVRYRRNRAITDAFEPGSTLKIFTVAAALEAGAIKPHSSLHCEQGRWKIGRYTIHDTHHHGRLSVRDILKHSSNICSSKIGFRLGKEGLYRGLKSMGFGIKADLLLPGGRRGILRKPDRWSDVGLANIAFGQGMTATVMQLTQGLTAVANGGLMMKPRLVSEVRKSTGETVRRFEPQGRRVMREEVATAVRKMLVSVTEKGGTGETAALERYTVAGKTGTAQKVDPKTRKYSTRLWVASFIGIVPASAPRLAIAVVVNDPDAKKKYYGGDIAAPIFRDIASRALSYLGVAPDKKAASPTVANRKKSSDKRNRLAKAKRQAELKKAKQAKAKRSKVKAENVALAKRVKRARAGTAVRLIPDFTGMSLGEAISAASKAKVQLQPKGSGRAVAQSPGPGPASKTEVCRVSFRPPN
jgi:cell division protein FtsI (penicillin-binding protein 3)